MPLHSCQRHIGSRILKFGSRFWQSRYLSNGHISIVATFGNLRSLSGVMVVGSFGQSGLTWAICLLGWTVIGDRDDRKYILAFLHGIKSKFICL